MEIHEKRRAFHTLDGLRGVAAILVVFRHIGPLMINIKNNFLAVDLFFLLSGFVIAYSYDRRIAAGGFAREFFLTRLIRLYPLYVLGLGLGVIGHLSGHGALSPAQLAEAFIIGLLMIPDNPLLPFGSSALNGPTWTLPWEMFANMMYAWFFRFLTRRVLAVVVAAGALGLVICAWLYGDLDKGWSFAQVPVALSRLCFSFFMGVLIFRRYDSRRSVRPLVAWTCLAVTAVILVAPVPARFQLAYQLLLILAGFPIILLISSKCEPDALSGKVFRFLGVVSYAVYAIHQPLSVLIEKSLVYLAHVTWPVHHRLESLALLATIVTVAWAVDEVYDVPVREWLRRRLLPARAERVRS